MGQSHSDEKKHPTTTSASDDKHSKHADKEKEADSKQTEAKQQPLPKPKKGWIIGKTEDIKKYYILGKQLGKPGQFGYAQAVTHKTTGAQRAIKVISKARFHSDQFDHFRREIQILKTLNHPNIIKGFEVFETADKLMLVMELCEGGELFDRIKAKGQYTEKDAAKVLSQIVEGIKYLHSRKIAHCDLKPDNFLFLTSAEDSVLKIIDFGMSKFVARRQYMSVLCGTSFYIAPEVIQGKYSESCDMWSLGVVMFIMIFGFPPFHGPDDRIRRSIMRGFKPVTKEGYGPFFPAAIPASDAAKDLIAKLLTQDTAKRLTAAETLEHPWMTGEAASDTPIVRNVLQNLSDFTANCKFKQAVLGALSDKMSEDELDALKKSFKAIDTNGDGTITADELKKALNSAQISESVEHIIKMADVDGDGKLSYQELVMASVHKKLMAKEERLWNTFCQLDQNGDGTVSADEIERVLGAQMNVREMISEVDKNGDGLIDYDEFVALWSAKELAANPHPPTDYDENKSED